jgi:hypothetical protein
MTQDELMNLIISRLVTFGARYLIQNTHLNLYECCILLYIFWLIL